jgi:hypothetical protein
MHAGLATVAAQEGGHRGPHEELIGRYDTGRGSSKGSHTSPCVTSGDERQPTRSGRVRRYAACSIWTCMSECVVTVGRPSSVVNGI